MTAAAWDKLHGLPRHQTVYPAEPVVRFLAAVEGREWKLALDIGAGNGRHHRLMRDLGFVAYGVDQSPVAAKRLGVHIAPMTDLPFPEDTFNVALSYGVFYYGTREEGGRAVEEMRRVLVPEGDALVCVRTSRDWRASVLVDGRIEMPGEPEHGMAMHFLDEHDIHDVYGRFTGVRYELQEFTTHDRKRLNSDWLITVTK